MAKGTPKGTPYKKPAHNNMNIKSGQSTTYTFPVLPREKVGSDPVVQRRSGR